MCIKNVYPFDQSTLYIYMYMYMCAASLLILHSPFPHFRGYNQVQHSQLRAKGREEQLEEAQGRLSAAAR